MMTKSEITEVMARAMQAHEWSGSATGKAPVFEGDERQYWFACAKATHDALTANGMMVVPIEVVQFDCTQYPAMEAKAVEIAGRISGRLGEKAELPDAVQVLRDAEELFLAGMADHDKYTTVATSKDITK